MNWWRMGDDLKYKVGANRGTLHRGVGVHRRWVDGVGHLILCE